MSYGMGGMGMGGMGMGGMGGMGMRGGMGMGGMGGGMGGQQQMIGPDGQPIQETFLQKIMRWAMSGMEMMQMPMMMFSQVMMMFQQQAMTLMMAVMMLPEMLMMLPMVTEQVKQMLGRSSLDQATGLTIPSVNYSPPPLKTRVGRRVERRLSNICTQVSGIGPLAQFGLKTVGLEPRAEEELNHLDWSEIIKKAEAEKDQAAYWAKMQADHFAKQAKQEEDQKQQMEQMNQQQQQQQGQQGQMGGMGMRSGMGGMGGYGGGMGMSSMGRMACVAAPIPAVFDKHRNTPGVEFLQQRKAMLDKVENEIVRELVKELDGDPGAHPQSFPGRVLLDQAARSTLIQVLDELHQTEPAADVKIQLSEKELAGMIGANASSRVLQFFGGPFDTIKMRRVEANGSDHCIAFHSDYSYRTMQIPLNEPSEYCGGSLLFATAAGFEQPDRIAGTPIIHTKNAVHGVTALTAGVRYSLFVCDTRQEAAMLGTATMAASSRELALAETAEVDLGYLVGPVLGQFDFFALAVPFLEGSSDAQLSNAVIEYSDFMARKAAAAMHWDHTRDPTFDFSESESFAVELVWRTHMLHPAAYKDDCAALLQVTLPGQPAVQADADMLARLMYHPWPEVSGEDGRSDSAAGERWPRPPPVYSKDVNLELEEVVVDATDERSSFSSVVFAQNVDLVAAMRRQAAFMQKILERRSELAKPAIVAAGVGSYREFLTVMRQSVSTGPGLVPPNAMVDLVWHTHQQWPLRYASDCLRIVGYEINHDDDQPEDQLDEGLELTRRAYSAAFAGARL